MRLFEYDMAQRLAAPDRRAGLPMPPPGTTGAGGPKKRASRPA